MAKKLWGGRFEKEIDKDFFEFQKSINYDYKLAKYDIVHSLIHTIALEKSGILSKPESAKLVKALKEIREKIKNESFDYDKNSEDIHTDIQNKIEKKLGKLALKLHSLRSRNDQIAFDEKAYCYDESGEIGKLIGELLSAFKFLIKKYKGSCIVGYTHTQRAEKVSFSDYLDAFWYMFKRDQERMTNFQKNINVYIGAGALAGSSITKKEYDNAVKKITKYISKESFFVVKPYVNSLDNVSDRDFIIELLSKIAIVQMHLSRLAEDFILYSTKEFNFVTLPEEFCTGSSLLPHKKNPDFLELVRGYTGRIYGNLISLLTTMKGLPLTYDRDMQLDKEPLFSSVEIIKNELKIMRKFIKKIVLNTKVIQGALKDEVLNAKNRLEDLVRKEKIPFKIAHDKIGRDLIKRLAARPIKRKTIV